MNFKTGVTHWCMADDIFSAVSLSATYNFDIIHIGIGDIATLRLLADKGWRNELTSLVRQKGLVVGGVALNILEQYGIALNDQVPYAGNVAVLLRLATTAVQDLETELIYIPCFDKSAITTANRFHEASETILYACRCIECPSIAIGCENTLSPEDNLRLANRIGHHRYRILLDNLNIHYSGYDPVSAIEMLHPFMLSQVHVKDGQHYILGNMPLGEGEGKVSLFLQALARHEFEGVIVLENDYRGGARERINKDKAFLTQAFATSMSTSHSKCRL